MVLFEVRNPFVFVDMSITDNGVMSRKKPLCQCYVKEKALVDISNESQKTMVLCQRQNRCSQNRREHVRGKKVKSVNEIKIGEMKVKSDSLALTAVVAEAVVQMLAKAPSARSGICWWRV